ncbi:MAG: FeS assembly protein IscX [Flavobacterium sp.]|jgi:FeS assembly protein IscX
MSIKWTDVNDIAIELYDAHPDVDPIGIRFTDLHAWVVALADFDDDPNRSGEKVLEAIQAAWIEEAE